jgi:adenosylcobinamide hydrolase
MLDFPGVQLTVTDDACTFTSDVPLTTLASAVVGGGFQRTRTILNRYVQRNYNCADPAGDLHSFAREDSFVGMLTGVQMRHVRAVTLRHEDLTVASVITAGVGNAMAAGVSEPVPLLPGTINIVVLIDANLVQSALVNAVITATEAKTGALMAHAISTAEGHAATGTSTDAIVIACTGRGAPLPYAGPATRVGYLIAASVRQCLAQALHLQKEKG